MTVATDTFAAWLEEAAIPVQRLTPEQQALLQATYRFRQRQGADYYSTRLLSHFLLHAQTGLKVAQVHLRHLNPFPRNLGDILRSYDKILVPEMNLGQLRKLVRAEFLVDAQGLNKVNGLPFRRIDIQLAILAQLQISGHYHGNGNGAGGAQEE